MAEKAVHDNLYNRGYRKGHSRGYKEGSNIVLSKIRAEIEEVQTYDGLYIDRAYVLQILDKYKADRSDT